MKLQNVGYGSCSRTSHSGTLHCPGMDLTGTRDILFHSGTVPGNPGHLVTLSSIVIINGHGPQSTVIVSTPVDTPSHWWQIENRLIGVRRLVDVCQSINQSINQSFIKYIRLTETQFNLQAGVRTSRYSYTAT